MHAAPDLILKLLHGVSYLAVPTKKTFIRRYAVAVINYAISWSDLKCSALFADELAYLNVCSHVDGEHSEFNEHAPALDALDQWLSKGSFSDLASQNCQYVSYAAEVFDQLLPNAQRVSSKSSVQQLSASVLFVSIVCLNSLYLCSII